VVRDLKEKVPGTKSRGWKILESRPAASTGIRFRSPDRGSNPKKIRFRRSRMRKCRMEFQWEVLAVSGKGLGGGALSVSWIPDSILKIRGRKCRKKKVLRTRSFRVL